MNSTFPNPDFPLLFEFLDDEMETGKITNKNNENIHPGLANELSSGLGYFDMGFRNSIFDSSQNDYYVDSITAEYTLKIIQNWGNKDKEEVLKLCKEALKASPVCAEAYLLMGYISNNYEDALSNFTKSIEIFPKSIKPKFLKEISKDIFKNHSPRTLFFALTGKANILRKLKRYQESYDTFMILTNSVSEDSNSSNYMNFRTKIPEVMMRLGKYQEALIYMKKYPESNDRNSSVFDWNLNRSLILFKLNKHQKNFASNIFSESNGVSQVLSFCSEFILYLNDEIKLPHIELFGMVSSTSEKPPKSLLALYVKSTKDMWKETKGAIEWMTRNVYTLALFQLCKVFPSNDLNYLEGLGLSKNFETFKMILTEKKPFTDAFTSDDGCTIVNSIVMNCPFEYSEFFVEKLGNSVNVDYHLQPIHMACYYDKPTEIIRFLIDHGANPIKNYPKVGSAYDMALNQGNWLVIKYLLSTYKELRTKKMLKYAFKVLCSSGCFYCLLGGPKCGRCINDSRPHSKNVSFSKSVQVLAENGLNTVPYHDDHPLEHFLRKLLNPKNNLKQITNQPHVHDENCNHSHEKHVHIHGENCNHSHDHEDDNVPKCGFCGKTNDVKLCSGCKKESYCSRECQVSHWKIHKIDCKKK